MAKDSPRKILEDIGKTLRFQASLGVETYTRSEALESFLAIDLTPQATGQSEDEDSIYSRLLAKKEAPVKDEIVSFPAKTLASIRQELGDCTRCSLQEGRSRILFGSGPSDARLMIVGEWPNRADDAEGVFYSGEAGELLRKMLAAIHVDFDGVYFTNIVKCRASEENPPSQDHITSCRPFLLSQIDVVKPQVIVSMGPLAAQILLRTNKLLIRLRGRVHKYKTIPMIPTFQPSYLLKNPEMKKAAWVDLQLAQRELGSNK